MDIGMLWYDSDRGEDVRGKIKRAARYYARKYGVEPDICFVHPEMIPEESAEGRSPPGQEVGCQVEGIIIQEDTGVLPDHYWIGVAKK